MAWRVARSLDVLLAQLNTIAPGRSRASDGGIGDAAHASRDSDHNPWFRLPGDPAGIVTARDFTHDPAGGLDGQRLADALARGRDRRIKYVIFNRRIMAGDGGPSPWEWRVYRGPNPHTKHVHVSVVADAICDDTQDWVLDGVAAPAAAEWADFVVPQFEWVTEEEAEPILFVDIGDQEDIGKFLTGLAGGAASGAATGAAAGPWGALIGAGIGAGLSALSQANAPKQPTPPRAPARPMPPPPPPPPPAPAPAPAPAVAPSRPPAIRLPKPAVRPAVVSQQPQDNNTAVQLALLLPLLTQLVQSMAAPTAAPAPRTAAAVADRSEPAADDAAWEDFAEQEAYSAYGPTGEYGEFDDEQYDKPAELGDVELIEGC